MTEVKPKDEGYIVVKSCVFELEGAKRRPAMSVEQRSLVLPRMRPEFMSSEASG